MGLKETLNNDLKQAMLARDELRVSTLRMLTSATKYYEIAKGGAGYEASDEEILGVIQKEIKQRRESIESFQKGGREDLVEKETKEMEILQAYLPEQLGEEEIRRLIKETVQEFNASSINDMGRVMSVLMPKLKGKADGSLVSRIVKEQLS